MTAPAPIIPIDDLFADPVRAGGRISPDGTRIAYLAPEGGRLNVWLRSVDEDDGVCVTHGRDRAITQYHWAYDDRYLLYMQDTHGDEAWHLYRVDVEDPDHETVDLTPMGPGSRVVNFEQLESDEGKALIAMNWPRVDTVDVHLLDIETGELTPVLENPGTVSTWIFTETGRILAQYEDEAHDYVFAVWEADSQELRPFAAFPGEDYPIGITVAQPTPDGEGMWVAAFQDHDELRLYRVEFATGEFTLVDHEPGHDLDVSGLLLNVPPIIQHPGTHELIAARYVGDRQILHVLDPAYEEVFERLTSLHDGDLGSVSLDEEARRWVVTFDHDTDPGATFLYDHGTGEAELLHRPYPHLDPATLAPMKPVTVTSRDGLPLHCHLTLPIGVAPTGLPTVVKLHGGPWFRDSWGWDQQVQFLANRGYAVLQVNFRGSVGYGRSFTKAAMHELAGKMHDDVIDAVRWAVDEGYADEDRVAIYGGSYGGYAALVGATFTPDVFACAVDYCGVSDLANFQRTLPPFVRKILYNNWGRYVGDPDNPEELADMLARSPVTRIDDLNIPLMVVQGANDVRVVQAESDNIVEGLRARGIEVEYMVKEDEGHGFANKENVIDMFRAMETFFDKHLA